MKKMVKILSLMVLCLFVAQIVMADEDEPGRRSGGKSWVLSKEMSIGLQLAQRLSYTWVSPDGVETTLDAKNLDTRSQFFGLNGKWFPLMGGKLGFSFDIINLDHMSQDYTVSSTTWNTSTGWDGYGWYQYYSSYTASEQFNLTMDKWLVDFDILYRLPLTKALVVNGGVGISYELLTWKIKNLTYGTEYSDSQQGAVGINFKVGGEYFLDDMFSIFVDWKWQTWETKIGKEKWTIFSVNAGVSLWI